MHIEIDDSTLEARIQKQVQATDAHSVEEALLRLLETQEEQDRWLLEKREAINAKIGRGIQQLDRGDGIPEDQLDAYLAKLKASLNEAALYLCAGGRARSCADLAVYRKERGVSTLERRSTDQLGGGVAGLFRCGRPVAIKIAAQANGSELDDGLGDAFGPAHSRTLHPILDQVLAHALDRSSIESLAKTPRPQRRMPPRLSEQLQAWRRSVLCPLWRMG